MDHPVSQPLAWPSQLARDYRPILPLMPQVKKSPSVAIASTTIAPVIASAGSTPRRTLTVHDRREMCLYHESHPGVRQEEVGGTFACSGPLTYFLLIISRNISRREEVRMLKSIEFHVPHSALVLFPKF